MGTRSKHMILLAGFVFVAGVIAYLVHAGVIRFNHPSQADYPVRGVDVTAYEGAIDWPALSAQGIGFAYLAAGEGAGQADPGFAENRAAARAAGLRVGAILSFRYDESGLSQAEALLAAAPPTACDLPPAVELTLYGAYQSNPLPADDVWQELRAALDALAAAYGKTPVVCCADRAYDLYLAERDEDVNVWIRSVYFSPRVAGWTFWQYTDQGSLTGYEGEANLDVFAGSEAEFAAY